MARGKYVELNSAKVFHGNRTQDVMLSPDAVIWGCIEHNGHPALVVLNQQEAGHYEPRTITLTQGREVEFPERGTLIGMLPNFGGDPYWIFEVKDEAQ